MGCIATRPAAGIEERAMALWAQITRDVTEPCLLLDANGAVIGANPAALGVGVSVGRVPISLQPALHAAVTRAVHLPLGEREVATTIELPDGRVTRADVVAQPVDATLGAGWTVTLRVADAAADTFTFLQRLHSMSSERRMTLEQRMGALFVLGAQHFGLPRVVQSRIEGRHYVVERCIDPSDRVEVGDDHALANTYCELTLRHDGPTAWHHAGASEVSERACYQEQKFEAYLGAPIYVDATRYGTLSFSDDVPRRPFTADERALVQLLAQWVGHEIARDRDLARYQRAQEELDRLARTDVLTRLPNRRAASEALQWQVAYVKRSRLPLTVMICDLDHFKAINDRYGHDGGDAVLRAFADLCRSVKRETDVCGRWGGEEFLFLLPSTHAEGAMVFADRLLEAVRRCEVTLKSGEVVRFTASLGSATIWSTESEDGLLTRADAALYRAKELGRDRAEFDQTTTPVPLPAR